LLTPASIAVVGASDDALSVGAALARNARAGFKGSMYAVNPRRPAVLGQAAHASVADLPEPVDLALIATPPESIPSVMQDCGTRGVRAAVIVSSGLSDQSADGARLLETVASIARQHRIRVLGPNSLGVMRPAVGLNATFASTDALPGTVALVAQSGAMVSAMLEWAAADELGFSSVISLGNKLDVGFAEVLDFLTADPATESILLYVEGIRSARRFMSALRAAARIKPVFVLKGGRERAGSQAAVTHTRSLAGRDDVFDAALQRAGAVRVRTFVQLFSAAKWLASRYRPMGNQITIVTNGGGPGVMAADRANELGIEVAPLSPQTLERLDRVLPPAWSRGNPVDLLEDADVARFREAVETCLQDPSTGGLLVILTPQAMTEPLEVARTVAQQAAASSKHVFACWMGEFSVHAARGVLAAARIPVFRSPEPAVEAFANVAAFYHNQRLLMQVPGPLGQHQAPDLDQAASLVRSIAAQGRSVLTESESKSLVAAFRIPIAPARVARSAAEAGRLAQQIGFPVAVKVNSTRIEHKHAVGGVRLDVRDAQGAREAFEAILSAISSRGAAAQFEGVAVQPMISKAAGVECLIGIFTDRLFGPVVMFGAGGVDAELIADQAVALPPLNAFLAQNLVRQTRIGRKILSQGRNREMAAIESVLLRVSEMACELPSLKELDLNPLAVDAEGGVVLDARAVIAATTPLDATGRYAHMAVHPYPAHLTRRLILPGGVEVQIRAIRPEDAELEKAFVRGLSPEARYFRFMSALHELSDRMLVRFTQIDYDREMALVALAREADRDEQIGVARYVIDAGGDGCEFAIVVADAWQARGIGHGLMQALMDAARHRGLKRMEGFVLHNNEKMLRLMERLRFDTRADPEDPSMRIVSRSLDAG
jgi:acetyltransferase